jgi:protein TonB
MSPVALAKAEKKQEVPEVRYLDYLTALETLNAHRVNPAPPFGLMLAFAFSLHIALMLGFAIFGGDDNAPQERLLQLRLGGLPELGAGAAINGGGSTPTPQSSAVASPETMLEQAFKPAKPAQRPAQPARRNIASSYRAVEPPSVPAKPRLAPSSQMPPAFARRLSPQAGTGGQGVKGGSAYGNSLSASAEVIARYEQELSGWLERHKVYPESAADAGLQGRVIVRVQMNRQGKVVGSWVEKSSGHQILDKAVLAQVMRANPFPPAPATYPGSALLEFRFPVTLYIR